MSKAGSGRESLSLTPEIAMYEREEKINKQQLFLTFLDNEKFSCKRKRRKDY